LIYEYSAATDRYLAYRTWDGALWSGETTLTDVPGVDDRHYFPKALQPEYVSGYLGIVSNSQVIAGADGATQRRVVFNRIWADSTAPNVNDLITPIEGFNTTATSLNFEFNCSDALSTTIIGNLYLDSVLPIETSANESPC